MKSVAEGSAAAVDGRLRVNDQIIEVWHYSLLVKQTLLRKCFCFSQPWPSSLPCHVQ